MTQRTRAYCFTVNNYDDDVYNAICNIDCQYLIVGKEIAPTTGTPHLQGYIYFTSAKTCSKVKKLIPGHVEPAKGSGAQNKEYCSKGGDVYEKGVMPIGGVGKQATMAQKIERNKQLMERPLNELVAEGHIHPCQVKGLYNARLICAQESPPYHHKSTRGVWVHGPPSVGKSYFARSIDESYYMKAQNKWFDGYTGQKVIIIDDMDSNCLGHYLKLWADEYPVTGEVKGGHVNLQHHYLVVTSNYSIADLFEDSKMREAIESRFVVKEMLVKHKRPRINL